MKYRRTARGFGIIEAEKYQIKKGEFTRLIQESSAIGDYEDSAERPGSSYLWIGQEHHLNREEVKEMAEVLDFWLNHRYLPDVPKNDHHEAKKEKNMNNETKFHERPRVSKTWIRECVAQGWCQKCTSHIDMDAVLAEAISEQIEKMFAECGFNLMS